MYELRFLLFRIRVFPPLAADDHPLCRIQMRWLHRGAIKIIPQSKILASCHAGVFQQGSAEYRGTLSKTVSGLTCQAWDTQHPSPHLHTPANYPGHLGNNNYCRDPDLEVKF